MASPQTEDGYTKIANELLDALCRIHLSGNEWCYVHALIRKTYGYNKKEDWITNSQICLVTGMNRQRVSEAKKVLVERGIVTENRNKISLNKNYEDWKLLRKSGQIVTENRNSLLRKTVHTKDNTTKDNKGGSSPQVLSTKGKKDMGNFDRVADDYEEGVVDLDGDGSLTPTEKPKKAKRPYKEVYALFGKILGVSTVEWLVNTTEQRSADLLYTEKGLEQVEKALRLYVEHKDEEYCPAIFSPTTLIRKWSQLVSFKKKNGI